MEHSSPISKGEQRRLRRASARRAEIIAAAGAVFREKGYAGATTKEIADRADVAEGTLYKYFASKRELLMAYVMGVVELSRSILDHMPPGDPESAQQDLAQAFTFHFTVVRDQPFLSMLIHEAIRMDTAFGETFQAQFMDPTVAASEERVSRWIVSGHGRRVDTRVAAQVINAMMIGFDVILSGKTDPHLESLDAESLGRCVADIVLNGLGRGTTDTDNQ